MTNNKKCLLVTRIIANKYIFAAKKQRYLIASVSLMLD